MNPWSGRPDWTKNVIYETGEDMALEVTVTIKSGAGYGAPWHVVKGTPKEIAGYLGIEEFPAQGQGSAIQAQLHKVAAWAAGDFESLNPGKG
jgi:hypothetical protein